MGRMPLFEFVFCTLPRMQNLERHLRVWVLWTKNLISLFDTIFHPGYRLLVGTSRLPRKCEIVHAGHRVGMFCAQDTLSCPHHSHGQPLSFFPSVLAPVLEARLFMLLSVDGCSVHSTDFLKVSGSRYARRPDRRHASYRPGNEYVR